MSVNAQPWLSIVLVTTLMFFDYYLTLKGQALGKIRYAKHLKVESYELNPNFQREIALGKYHWTHFVSVVGVGLLLYVTFVLSQQGYTFFAATTYDFMRGILLSMFVYINCRHIQNILLFKKVNAEPKLLSGTLKQAHAFSLYSGKVHAYTTALLFLAFWAFVPSWLTFGFAIGPFLIGRKHARWAKKK